MKFALRRIWRSIRANVRTMRRGSYAIIAILLGLFVYTIVIADRAWTFAGEADVSAAGYIAMVFGVLFSLIVGIGLMGLLFYSSRAGYDEPAKLIVSAIGVSETPNHRNSLKNSLSAGNSAGDGCDQHCVASQPMQSIAGQTPGNVPSETDLHAG